MKLGALGELIAPNGQLGEIVWESDERLHVTAIYEHVGDAWEIRAHIFRRDAAIRLEEAAAFIGYLQDEANA